MTIKGLVSVIIPARNEIFLMKTIQDILDHARGEIEIIVNLDGYWPGKFEVKKNDIPTTFKQTMIEDPRVIYIHQSIPKGMRYGINAAANVARGEFLLKSDAHCMYEEGFDLKLKADVPYYTAHTEGQNDNWIVIPRRKRLDAEEWKIQDVGKVDVDYEYLSSRDDKGVKGNKWDDRSKAKMDVLIDETMSFQGSCWFMTKNHYLYRLGGMDDNPDTYGTFVREAQEIGLKTWMSGGRVYVNKKTWYAHLHKGPIYGRMYYIDQRKMIQGNNYCDDFWFNNRWDKAIHDMAWLVERFSPVPTWTPELIEQVRKRG